MNDSCTLSLNSAYAIRVRGTVQGVGFRPFIAQLAEKYDLTGNVSNDAEGVFIQVWGLQENIEHFINEIKIAPPPLAEIHRVETRSFETNHPPETFSIRESKQGITATQVAPDAAVCQSCIEELFDRDNRRFHYPFINCTHCGPRFSIISKMPYDRPFTSMATFFMCAECEAEYQDHHDRRYHAQPNACPECGPKVWFEDLAEKQIGNSSAEAIDIAAQWLKQGKIIAVKGIGGFHLVCDARNTTSVNELRHHKQRETKPLAVMARDLAQLSTYVIVSELEKNVLQSSQAPITLIPTKTNHDLSPAIAPGQSSIGVMLPYTPLHHLLMHAIDFPVVMTSGNLSESPQYIDNDDARNHLSKLADGFLMHDRTIVNRLDDSVVRVLNGKARLLRRGRGYAPACLYLHEDFHHAPAILAMGAELKSTFCLLRQGQAVVSQHIGDLENQSVLEEYRGSLELYRELYDFTPELIATDFHPNYLSSQYGEMLAAHFKCQHIQVQHHHAHIAAVMAENQLGLSDAVIGISLDGLGMGTDGQLWGAEVMLSTYANYQHLASCEASPLIGGSQAMREPWRNVYAHLNKNWDEVTKQFSSLPLIQRLKEKPLSNIDQMINRNINSPMATSMGRVFDAVAAAVGICFDKQEFEGEAAMRLETLATATFDDLQNQAYTIDINWQSKPVELSWQTMWLQLLTDLHHQISPENIAARFHLGLVQTLTELVMHFANSHPSLPIVLCGGVFQNKLLFEGLSKALCEHQKNVLSPAQFPSNDGALSLGQAVIAYAQLFSSGQHLPANH